MKETTRGRGEENKKGGRPSVDGAAPEVSGPLVSDSSECEYDLRMDFPGF